MEERGTVSGKKFRKDQRKTAEDDEKATVRGRRDTISFGERRGAREKRGGRGRGYQELKKLYITKLLY